MKAAVLTAPEKIRIEAVQKPSIARHEILVKLKCCGICTLEQRLFTGELKLYYPIIPGHEASGRVVQVGEAVIENIKPGARVALDLVIRCGECYFCRIGQSNMCLNRFKKGRRILGGFGEYMAVGGTQLYPIPDSLSYKEATFAEPVACCIRSLKKVGLSLAEDILILGAGPMGLLHLQVALCFGARVMVSDPHPQRRQKAGELGAFLTIDPESQDLAGLVREHTEGRGIEACVITTPAPEALASALSALAPTGRINIYTSYSESSALPIDANTIHRREQLITGSEGRTEYDFLQAVRLLSFGKVKVEPLISATVTYEGIEGGIREAMSQDTYRVLLDHEALR